MNILNKDSFLSFTNSESPLQPLSYNTQPNQYFELEGYLPIPKTSLSSHIWTGTREFCAEVIEINNIGKASTLSDNLNWKTLKTQTKERL